MPLYPRLHLLPTGDIVCTNSIRESTYTLAPDVGPNGGTFTRVCDFRPSFVEYGAFSKPSVLLPLLHKGDKDAKDRHGRRWTKGYKPRVLVCGDAQAWILDLSNWGGVGSTPIAAAWQPAASRSPKPIRRHSNAVILPTGEIFVSGGIDMTESEVMDLRLPQSDSRSVLDPEMYNPFTNKWKWLNDPPMKNGGARNYHSVALLMPDGRVWVAGSDKDARQGCDFSESFPQQAGSFSETIPHLI
jgi:hypothetical protein